MTVPEFGGCPWPMDPACATAEWDALDADVQERALALASATLRMLTGYRVGACPITIRPVDPAACTVPLIAPGDNYGPGFQPINYGGVWRNVACGVTRHCELTLPPPVGRVDEIKLDGAVVDPADYRVDGNIVIWSGDGDCPWPASQDLSKDDDQPGTFSVTYLNAYPVDSLGAYAVGVLALEFGKACAGDDCELPDGVTTIVRQGITMQITSGAFPNGETGLRPVDTYIALWNPKHRRPTTIWSPQRHRTRLQG